MPNALRTSAFSVVFAVAPGEQERVRAIDLLASLFHHEPDVARVLLIEDGAEVDAILDTLPPAQRSRISVVSNPRAGRGVGWRDGLTVGLFAAYMRFGLLPEPSFVVKLDTDSLIIGPFATRIAGRFARDSRLGIIGTHTVYPDGTEFVSAEFHPLVRWTGQLVYFNHTSRFAPRGLHFNLHRRARRRRTILQRARRAGYRDTACCQGGGYALSASFLNAARAAGHFADPLLWLGSPLTEDIVMGITCSACGFTMADYNGTGEAFGVKYSGLPGSLDELVRRDYGIIHSVKNDPRFSEAEVRGFFRGQRHADTQKALSS